MRSLQIVFALIFTMTFANFTYAQEKSAEFEAEIEVFQHISEYENLVIKELPTDIEVTSLPLPDGTALSNKYVPTLPDNGTRGVTSTTTVYHNFRNKNGYFSNDQGVTFSPALYGYYNSYSRQWQPTTITFPQPAVSVTINVYD